MKMFQPLRWALCLGLLFSAFASAAPLTEQQKIDVLIHSVETLPGAHFIRNGRSYDGKAAADHLQKKRKYAGSRITTASDFIDKCASKSSMSGLPYRIQFANGKTEEASVFFHDELKQLEASPTGTLTPVAVVPH